MNEFAVKYNTNTIALETIIVDYEKQLADKNFIISELIKKLKSHMNEMIELKSLLQSQITPINNNP